MPVYAANRAYVEAMSALLMQYYLVRGDDDEGVRECLGQLVEQTQIFIGLDEQEALRMIKEQADVYRGGLNGEALHAWYMPRVQILPYPLREKTFAIAVQRYTDDGKLIDGTREPLEAFRELLGVAPAQAAKIIEVCGILSRDVR